MVSGEHIKPSIFPSESVQAIATFRLMLGIGIDRITIKTGLFEVELPSKPNDMSKNSMKSEKRAILSSARDPLG